MASQTSPHSEVGSRYANALYDLASEAQALDVVEGDLKGLASTISGSKELQSVIENPVFSRDDKFNAITALLKQGNANVLVQNVAGLMAKNGRLNVLPGMIVAFQQLAADARGEVSATAISATALNDEQTRRLRAEIEASVGKAVNLETEIDPSLLGGLIVKVGSRMVDSSLRTKLNKLKLAMKEA